MHRNRVPTCTGIVYRHETGIAYRHGRITQETTYTYDDNGNTLSKTSSTDTVNYTYDDANRLMEATDTAGSTSYVYDADGLRVRSTHTPSGGTATTTWYVQDKAYPYAQAIEQYQSEGSGPKRLTVTTTFADDLVSQTRYEAQGCASAEGAGCAGSAGDNGDGTQTPSTRFVQADGFGSTRLLTDEAGNITDTIDYDAFGNVIERTGTSDIDHLYRGEALDPNTGFYYLRARWYAPESGRFVTQDTFAGYNTDPRSLHKYTYTHNNPVNGIDPSGHVNLVQLGVTLNVVGIGVNVATYAVNIITGNYVGLAENIVEDVASTLIPGGAIAKNTKRLAQWLMRGETFMVGLRASSHALRHNMLQMGIKGCEGCAAHHLIPGTEKKV